MDEKILLSPKDIVSYLGVSKATVYTLLKRKDLPVIKIGSRKYVTKDDLNNWLKKQVIDKEEN